MTEEQVRREQQTQRRVFTAPAPSTEGIFPSNFADIDSVSLSELWGGVDDTGEDDDTGEQFMPSSQQEYDAAVQMQVIRLNNVSLFTVHNLLAVYSVYIEECRGEGGI